MELFGESEANCRAFFEAMLGTDWEERLIIGGAVAGRDATDDDVDLARERAAVIAEEARPNLEWDEALRNDVRRAWFAL